MVFQLPCGTLASKRSPRGAQPPSGAISDIPGWASTRENCPTRWVTRQRLVVVMPALRLHSGLGPRSNGFGDVSVAFPTSWCVLADGRVAYSSRSVRLDRSRRLLDRSQAGDGVENGSAQSAGNGSAVVESHGLTPRRPRKA